LNNSAFPEFGFLGGPVPVVVVAVAVVVVARELETLQIFQIERGFGKRTFLSFKKSFF
jgi:hypothetical protein